MWYAEDYDLRADLTEYDRMTDSTLWIQLLVGTYKEVEEKKKKGSVIFTGRKSFFIKCQCTCSPTTVIKDIYFMKVENTGSITLANGNVRIGSGDYCWSTVFREGISASKIHKVYVSNAWKALAVCCHGEQLTFHNAWQNCSRMGCWDCS